MNIRVISVVLLIILFAAVSLMLNLAISEGSSLTEAYSTGNVKIIQKTAAGTIPHEIEITNNGNTTINVAKGDVLASSVSQDLVIAEDKQVATNSKQNIKAYCLEPSQRAVVDSKLLPVNNTYNGVNKVISSSNPHDSQSAYNAQLEIWVIMSGGNLNPYTGEPVAVVETKQIGWTQFRQNLADAKNEVLKTFNISEGEIQNLNQKQSFNPQDWINNTITWIKNSLGLQ
jgi:hypothetical protein